MDCFTAGSSPVLHVSPVRKWTRLPPMTCAGILRSLVAGRLIERNGTSVERAFGWCPGGLSSPAGPVFTRGSEMAATVSLALPSFRIAAGGEPRLAQTVAAAAADLSSRLGHVGPASVPGCRSNFPHVCPARSTSNGGVALL